MADADAGGGIDPDAEAKLLGLQHAVVGGRYLRENEQPVQDIASGVTPGDNLLSAPVLIPNDPYLDETAHVPIYRLPGVPLRALDDVSVRIDPSAMVALMGPPGSGKSTLLHLIGGLGTPDSGELKVGEQTISGLSRRDLAEYRRHVGFVFQRFCLLPALTALDNVIAPVIPQRVRYDKVQRGRALLAAVGLAEKEVRCLRDSREGSSSVSRSREP